MFTEQDTEQYYDHKDDLYRSFWDPAGGLHYGYFPDPTAERSQSTAEQLLTAFRDWDEELLARSGITGSSTVLDVGCGNGTTSVWLARHTGCQVTGIDLSQVRTDNARRLGETNPDARVTFRKASATDIPYSDGAFSHAWSQATLYHVHERSRALAEVHRVLRDDGVFAFDDLTTPRTPVGPTSQRLIYDRLLFEPTFSAEQYVARLAGAGFEVEDTIDLSRHLKGTYELLVKQVTALAPELAVPYQAMIDGIDAGEVGWSGFTCRKVARHAA
ncbi:methyltransferase domain-containing protein [Streptomyces sp. NA02950]|uniref:SAM-dependent methyltransferase n=1 Tax=Streptomyces sp. NA02950 TaxID=2742137 RepID=UPI0015912796|nr:class I SAM-dependent methyltransferase [Streptomyces sp. NA02950]QKV90701.1 methyltransferase domain-containing protein [Streptomyces sp. NA02950]